MRVAPITQSTGSRTDQAKFLMQSLQRIEALQIHALMLGQMSALERLSNFLLSHISGSANQSDDLAGEPAIQLSVTREEIGDYLGLTIETVSRCFGKLKRAGIIKLKQADRICINNPAGLRAIASQSGRAMRSK
jgi:CRP-like cAMP-binding protein